MYDFWEDVSNEHKVAVSIVLGCKGCGEGDFSGIWQQRAQLCICGRRQWLVSMVTPYAITSSVNTPSTAIWLLLGKVRRTRQPVIHTTLSSSDRAIAVKKTLLQNCCSLLFPPTWRSLFPDEQNTKWGRVRPKVVQVAPQITLSGSTIPSQKDKL